MTPLPRASLSRAAAWLRVASSTVAIVVAIAAGATTLQVAAPPIAAVGTPVPRQPPDPAPPNEPSSGPSAPASPAPAPSSTPPAPSGGPSTRRDFTMAFTGDILIHSSLWERAGLHAGGAGYDFRPLLGPVRPVLQAADLAICHLETPLSPDDRDIASYPVFETPASLADAIAWAGYDGCSTASNHSLDGGVDGVRATLRHLDRVGLGHAGTARSKAEARRITTYRVAGARIAHLSFTFGFNGFVADTPWRANRIDVPAVLADVARARAAGADLVVVSLHWGVEYTQPTMWQRQTAARLARSPAIDLLVGHHAHVVQPVTRTHGTWVAYGLGNLLSGMTSSLGTPAVADGVVLRAHVRRHGGAWRIDRLSAVPTMVRYGTWQVLPVARTLARAWPTEGLRADLRASRSRTISAMCAGNRSCSGSWPTAR